MLLDLDDPRAFNGKHHIFLSYHLLSSLFPRPPGTRKLTAVDGVFQMCALYVLV